MSEKWEKKQYKIIQNKSFKEANLLKLNCNKALKLLNWKSTLNFEETARFTIEYYKAIIKNNNKNNYYLMKKQINDFQKRMII